VTPAEHRAEAERLVEAAIDPVAFTDEQAEVMRDFAKVHALLALAPATPLPPSRPKPAQRVEVFDVEHRHLAVYRMDLGIVLDHPSSEWSTLLDDPAQVRLLADTLTAHADRMENPA
jgi:hypothetical protein